MSDWDLPSVEVQVDSTALVKPPTPALIATIGVALVSGASVVFNSAFGYLIAVVASVLGGFTALQDQKRRGHPSYVTLSWFSPLLRIVRYLILAITLMHVARLAIDAAEGSGLLW